MPSFTPLLPVPVYGYTLEQKMHPDEKSSEIAQTKYRAGIKYTHVYYFTVTPVTSTKVS